MRLDRETFLTGSQSSWAHCQIGTGWRSFSGLSLFASWKIAREWLLVRLQLEVKAVHFISITLTLVISLGQAAATESMGAEGNFTAREV